MLLEARPSTFQREPSNARRANIRAESVSTVQAFINTCIRRGLRGEWAMISLWLLRQSEDDSSTSGPPTSVPRVSVLMRPGVLQDKRVGGKERKREREREGRALEMRLFPL